VTGEITEYLRLVMRIFSREILFVPARREQAACQMLHSLSELFEENLQASHSYGVTLGDIFFTEADLYTPYLSDNDNLEEPLYRSRTHLGRNRAEGRANFPQ
jgi:hypothetical protein